ncbi:MAG: retropepsin-like aspartic protease family protein [Methyloligella sp. ZOD6]
MSTWVALFILAFGAILLLSDSTESVANVDAEMFGYVVMSLALLIFIGGGVFARYGGRAGAMFRDLVTWAALGLALVTIYTYRDALLPVADRVMGELMPGRGVVIEETATGRPEVKLRKRLGGHFTAMVDVEGKPVSMIVDTGATTVVLRSEDAEEIGIETGELRYNIPVLTANGKTLAARVRLGEVAIGPLKLEDVAALVARQGSLSESLLGMSFLSRLRSYEFSGNYLTLRG